MKSFANHNGPILVFDLVTHSVCQSIVLLFFFCKKQKYKKKLLTRKGSFTEKRKFTEKESNKGNVSCRKRNNLKIREGAKKQNKIKKH